MRKIIIPLDFSETSLNAARFTAKMVAGQPDTSILLYHNYHQENEKEIHKSYIESLQQELLEKSNSAVEYEIEKGGELINNLDRLAHTRRATLIAMGITGRSEFQQKFIGSNTLKMVDRSIYPVMIIPPDAAYKKIKNVAFACDFKDVESNTPTTLIKSVLELFKPKLHIVNVNPEFYVAITEESKEQQEKLSAMFTDYEKEFHFITMNDFQDGIHSFLSEFDIDMLITIPRHHSGQNSLWATSNTRKLAYHNQIPILTSHQ